MQPICKCWKRDTDDVTILRRCKYNCGCRCHTQKVTRPFDDYVDPLGPSPRRQDDRLWRDNDKPRIGDVPPGWENPRISC